MADPDIRALERVTLADPTDTRARETLEHARRRTCDHSRTLPYLGSQCPDCGRPDPRTQPGARPRNPTRRYGVRRFTVALDGTSECFEVFDRVTGKCASGASYRTPAEDAARRMNRGEPTITEPCGCGLYETDRSLALCTFHEGGLSFESRRRYERGLLKSVFPARAIRATLAARRKVSGNAMRLETSGWRIAFGPGMRVNP